MRPLVSVHVAKAAGTSTHRLLRDAYGTAFKADYADNPSNPLAQRNLDPLSYFARKESLPDGIDCVHGHFHPAKYAIPKQCILSTVLREPVDNLLSIYFFWKAMRKGNDALHDYFVDHRLSIRETARLPLLRTLLSQTYFEAFDMGRFDMIGRYEDRHAALSRLSALIGIPLDAERHENTTPADPERQEATADPVLRRDLEDILAADLRFYERHAR